MAISDYLPNLSSNYYVIGGIVGSIILVIIAWYFIRGSRSGRISEEYTEEEETEQLEGEEGEVIKLQKDEKKNCRRMDDLFSDIMIILRNSGNNALAEQILKTRMRISYLLSSLKKEKMSLKNTRDSFLELHNLINEFISSLPKDNERINMAVAEIMNYQNNYYRDLVREVAKQRHQLQIVEDLKRKIVDEIQGSGYQRAA